MKPTHILLLIVALILLGYDIYSYIALGEGTTISEVIWQYSKEHPIIPFLGGMLANHFWWVQ